MWFLPFLVVARRYCQILPAIARCRSICRIASQGKTNIIGIHYWQGTRKDTKLDKLLNVPQYCKEPINVQSPRKVLGNIILHIDSVEEKPWKYWKHWNDHKLARCAGVGDFLGGFRSVFRMPSLFITRNIHFLNRSTQSHRGVDFRTMNGFLPFNYGNKTFTSHFTFFTQHNRVWASNWPFRLGILFGISQMNFILYLTFFRNFFYSIMNIAF